MYSLWLPRGSIYPSWLVWGVVFLLLTRKSKCSLKCIHNWQRKPKRKKPKSACLHRVPPLNRNGQILNCVGIHGLQYKWSCVASVQGRQCLDVSHNFLTELFLHQRANFHLCGDAGKKTLPELSFIYVFFKCALWIILLISLLKVSQSSKTI